MRQQRRVILGFDDFSALRKRDRKSTRLNSSHVSNSYAVFCLKKKTSPEPTVDVTHRHGTRSPGISFLGERAWLFPHWLHPHGAGSGGSNAEGVSLASLHRY